MSIPNEAVEAAKEAMLSKDGKNLPGEDWEAWQLRLAKMALEAAAPYLLKELADSRVAVDGVAGELFRFTWEQREWLRGGSK